MKAKLTILYCLIVIILIISGCDKKNSTNLNSTKISNNTNEKREEKNEEEIANDNTNEEENSEEKDGNKNVDITYDLRDIEDTLNQLKGKYEGNDYVMDIWAGYDENNEMDILIWNNDTGYRDELNIDDVLKENANNIHIIEPNSEAYPNSYFYTRIQNGSQYEVSLNNFSTQENSTNTPPEFIYKPHTPKYLPHQAYKRQIKDLLQERLIKIELKEAEMGEYKSVITIEGYNEEKITEEIAQLLVFNFGRFYSTWIHPIYQIEIIYKTNGEKQFTVQMRKGEPYIFENPKLKYFMPYNFYSGVVGNLQYDEDKSIKCFNRWVDSGLKANDWINNANIEIHNQAIDTSIFSSSDYKGLLEKSNISDPGYGALLEKIKSYQTVKGVFLAYEDGHYKTLITMDYISEDENIKNQMDITEELMKYPVEEIWFKTIEQDEIINMVLFDRVQYKFLTYLNKSQFDFEVMEWPIMARYFGESENTSIDKEDSEKDVTDEETDALESWVGEYEFSEFAPPDQNKFYEISLYKENSNYYADISIDGFQTIIRLQTKVIGDENSINLVFEKYLPDNLFESYNKGDILLSFEKENSEIYTSWGEIKPMLESNEKSGQVYFEIEK
ncbi:MAG: DUF5991 domain-containing protein [bacterium]